VVGRFPERLSFVQNKTYGMPGFDSNLFAAPRSSAQHSGASPFCRKLVQTLGIGLASIMPGQLICSLDILQRRHRMKTTRALFFVALLLVLLVPAIVCAQTDPGVRSGPI